VGKLADRQDVHPGRVMAVPSYGVKARSRPRARP
jgi:hypothetical protein